MSYENQPEPVLPNYNPSAWAPPLSAEEQEVLDAYYVKFPIAQNAPITFPSNITTNGTLNAGTISSTTDTVTIGTGKNINLGVAIPANGYISIGSGSHGGAVGMNLGSESLGNVYFRSGSIELNTTATSGNIILGGTGNAGAITVNKPLTIGYSVPTSSTQLGYTISSYIGNKILTANNGGANQTITSFTLPVGTWICSYQIRYYSESTTTMTQSKAIMSLVTVPVDWGNNFGFQQNNITQTITTGANMMVSSSSTIYNISSQTLYLYDASTYSTTTGNFYAIGAPKDTYLVATRIA